MQRLEPLEPLPGRFGQRVVGRAHVGNQVSPPSLGTSWASSSE
jgi:hypothetical protein